MQYLIKGAEVFCKNEFQKVDLFVANGRIAELSDHLVSDGAVVLPLDGCVVFPGFTDVHVHFREPGFSYKETIASGSLAAAHGGYTSVCTMPNLNPCPDTVEHLAEQEKLIHDTAVIHIYPYGTITKGEAGEELADIEQMRDHVIGYSDDGRGIQNAEMMEAAMRLVKMTGKLIAAHCEDNRLLHGGYIHDGEYAQRHGHKGICSESEWGPIKRDIELVKRTGCRYHVCHISCKESVELIRQAKAQGVDITCETGPHYLTMNDGMLQEDGRYKMNPPIRSEEDRLALIEGIKDGTIDMIATDHAPHSVEEKSRGLEKSLMGVVGLETAFPICYTKLVKTGVITIERLLELLHTGAKKRFGIGSDIEIGAIADLTVFDLNEEYEIDPKDFLSKGKASPFTGEKVFGKCKLTMVGGRIIWQENLTEKSF